METVEPMWGKHSMSADPQKIKVLIIAPRAHSLSLWAGPVRIATALNSIGIQSTILAFSCKGLDAYPQWLDRTAVVFNRIPFWFRMIDPVAAQNSGYFHSAFEHYWDSMLQSFCCMLKAVYLIKREKFTAAHFVDGLTPMTMLSARFIKIPMLHNCNTTIECNRKRQSLARNFLYMWLVRQAKRCGRVYFIFANKYTARTSQIALGKYAVYIPITVPPVSSLPDRTNSRKYLRLSQTQTIFLLFGSQRLTKDYRTVFQAARLLTPNPLLLFAGPVGNNNPATLAVEYQYKACVIVNQLVPEDEVIHYFRAADAIILPYVPGCEETFGSGVLFDAIQFDCPIIATHTEGFDDIIQNYQCGFQYTHERVEELAECMRKYINLDDGGIARLKAGLAQARQEHAMEKTARQYLELYQSCS